MRRCWILLLIALWCARGALVAFADEGGDVDRVVGDVFAYGLPVGTVVTTLAIHDSPGTLQLAFSWTTSITTVMILKNNVEKERPDHSDFESFPSGHSASAFSAASFIHFRYGLKYAAIPYAGATFVAWSRVRSERHYAEDVIAGAAISVLFSRIFTRHRESPVEVSAWWGHGEASVRAAARW